MRKIFWDTNLFIYLIEASGAQYQRTVELLSRMTERHDHLITSALTLGEVLTGPMRSGNSALARSYAALIQRRATIVSFDSNCAEAFARIRTDASIKPPDAIQLACAACANVDLFVTNDARLSRTQIDGISFIVPLDKVWI